MKWWSLHFLQLMNVRDWCESILKNMFWMLPLLVESPGMASGINKSCELAKVEFVTRDVISRHEICLRPCHTVQFVLQLATQFCSWYVKNISANFDGNLYLPILHLPRIELHCKLEKKCIVSQLGPLHWQDLCCTHAEDLGIYNVIFCIASLDDLK